MSLELAFNISSYLSDQKRKTFRLADDLSALVMETSSVHQRVTYWQCQREKILENLSESDPATQRTYEIYDLMTKARRQHVVIWFSPAGDKYPETRINLYIGNGGQQNYENYSLATNHSPKECLEMSNQLRQLGADFINKEVLSLETPEMISPLEYLQQFIDLPAGMWEFILNGQAKTKKAEAFTIASILSPVILSLLSPKSDKSLLGLLFTGAVAEYYLSGMGFAMRGAGSGCGFTNSEIISSSRQKEGGCEQITCPACGWKPNKKEESEVMSGHLTSCPCCGYCPHAV